MSRPWPAVLTRAERQRMRAITADVWAVVEHRREDHDDAVVAVRLAVLGVTRADSWRTVNAWRFANRIDLPIELCEQIVNLARFDLDVAGKIAEVLVKVWDAEVASFAWAILDSVRGRLAAEVRAS